MKSAFHTANVQIAPGELNGEMNYQRNETLDPPTVCLCVLLRL